jgi:hypothetical protein
VYRWLYWYGHDDTDDFIDFDDDDGSDGDKDDHDDDYCYFLLLILTATMYIKFLDVSLDKLLTNYEVLVSSPGISNTLTTNRDFETFKVQYVLTVLCLFLLLDQWWYDHDFIMIKLLSATWFIACLWSWQWCWRWLLVSSQSLMRKVIIMVFYHSLGF